MIPAFFVSLLTNKWVIIGLVAVTAAVVAYLWIWHSAQSAALAAAAILALQRTAAAQKAKSEVKPNDQDAMASDRFNRDNRR